MTEEMTKYITEDVIHYIIMEAYPDYKRPHILHKFGKIEKNKFDDFLLNELVEFVYDRIDIANLENIQDIENFWLHFYDDEYMDNSPWDAVILENGEWKNKCPSNKKLLEALIKARDET